MPLASVYPYYEKVEKKGRTKANVDKVICWLTGYSRQALQKHLDGGSDFETFFAQAPEINPNASRVTGVICGHCVEEIEDKLMHTLSRQTD